MDYWISNKRPHIEGQLEVPTYRSDIRIRIVDFNIPPTGDQDERRRGLEVSYQDDFTGAPVWLPATDDDYEQIIQHLINHVVLLSNSHQGAAE